MKQAPAVISEIVRHWDGKMIVMLKRTVSLVIDVTNGPLYWGGGGGGVFFLCYTPSFYKKRGKFANKGLNKFFLFFFFFFSFFFFCLWLGGGGGGHSNV